MVFFDRSATAVSIRGEGNAMDAGQERRLGTMSGGRYRRETGDMGIRAGETIGNDGIGSRVNAVESKDAETRQVASGKCRGGSGC